MHSSFPLVEPAPVSCRQGAGIHLRGRKKEKVKSVEETKITCRKEAPMEHLLSIKQLLASQGLCIIPNNIFAEKYEIFP